MQPSLYEILGSTEVFSRVADNRFFVEYVPNSTQHLFGRTGDGSPCLLVATRGDEIAPPIELAGIRAIFGMECEVASRDGATTEHAYSVITCTNLDDTVQRYFAHVCETIVKIVGERPQMSTIRSAVEHLVDLFQKMREPSTTSAQGLFAELFVISVSAKPEISLAAWHDEHDERFDFAIGKVRLEVKSTASARRVHYFARTQCEPPIGALGVLASLFVQSSGGGTSLLEIIRDIETHLVDNEALTRKLHTNVAYALGETMPQLLGRRFDRDLAKSSLRLFDLSEIPAVRGPIPPEVNDIRFNTDLSQTPELNVADVAESVSADVHPLLPRWLTP